jgi:hypothetical protein
LQDETVTLNILKVLQNFGYLEYEAVTVNILKVA